MLPNAWPFNAGLVLFNKTATLATVDSYMVDIVHTCYNWDTSFVSVCSSRERLLADLLLSARYLGSPSCEDNYVLWGDEFVVNDLVQPQYTAISGICQIHHHGEDGSVLRTDSILTDTASCCDHNYIRARGPPGGCNENPGLGLLSSLVLTRWDPRSAIIYGELPRPEEAAILLYDRDLFAEASATSEKSTKLESNSDATVCYHRHGVHSLGIVCEAITTTSHGRYRFSNTAGDNIPATILRDRWRYLHRWQHMSKVLRHVDGEMINSPAEIHEDNDIGTQ